MNKRSNEIEHIRKTLKEYRDYIYSIVQYFGEFDNDNGIIYDDGEYTTIQQEQACELQRRISAYMDMLSQIVCDDRQFDNVYFSNKLRGQ